MKKITLFITLIALTFGYSQSIPITFDSGIIAGAKADGVVSPSDANWFSDSGLTSVSIEDLPSDSPDHGNAGKIVSSAAGAAWQNAQILLHENRSHFTNNSSSTSL